MIANEQARRIIESRRESLNYREWIEKVERIVVEIIEEEREACAAIADNYERQEIEAGQDSNQRGAGLSGLGHAFESAAANRIAAQIRARSNPELEVKE